MNLVHWIGQRIRGILASLESPHLHRLVRLHLERGLVTAAHRLPQIVTCLPLIRVRHDLQLDYCLVSRR